MKSTGKFLGAFLALLVAGQAPPAEAASANIAAELAKMANPSLQVFPWLQVGTSRDTDVAGFLGLQNLAVVSGTSAYSGGALMNVVTLGKEDIFGIKGLHLMSLGFGTDRKLASVVFLVDRGYQGKNIEPLIRKIAERYSSIARPVLVKDDFSEAKDEYILYDLTKFVIEVAIPEGDGRVTVTFATRKVYEDMRKADRTDFVLRKLK